MCPGWSRTPTQAIYLPSLPVCWGQARMPLHSAHWHTLCIACLIIQVWLWSRRLVLHPWPPAAPERSALLTTPPNPAALKCLPLICGDHL